MAILDVANSPHGGRVRLLPDNKGAPPTRPRLLIFHSIVGSAEGAYRYFRDATNLESTFIVTLGGQVWQLMDTTREADANYRANPFAVSVETEDSGNPDTEPWTAAQLDALTWIAHECHRIHGIPLRRADAWDGSGIGYHVLFGAPGPWTPVRKSCPGRVRIRQFDEVLLPRIAAGGKEVDVNVDELYARLTDPDATYSLPRIQRGVLYPGTTEARLDKLETKVDTLLSRQSGGDDGGPVIVRLADDQLAGLKGDLKAELLAELRTVVSELALPQTIAQAVGDTLAGRLQQ